MRYFWCWIFPPLGMLTAGRPGLAIIAFILCCSCVGYLPAAIWSYIVAAESYAEDRNEKLVRAMRGQRSSRREEESADDADPFAFRQSSRYW